jgi:hypothetical protein
MMQERVANRIFASQPASLPGEVEGYVLFPKK